MGKGDPDHPPPDYNPYAGGGPAPPPGGTYSNQPPPNPYGYPDAYGNPPPPGVGFETFPSTMYAPGPPQPYMAAQMPPPGQGGYYPDPGYYPQTQPMAPSPYQYPPGSTVVLQTTVGASSSSDSSRSASHSGRHRGRTGRVRSPVSLYVFALIDVAFVAIMAYAASQVVAYSEETKDYCKTTYHVSTQWGFDCDNAGTALCNSDERCYAAGSTFGFGYCQSSCECCAVEELNSAFIMAIVTFVMLALYCFSALVSTLSKTAHSYSYNFMFDSYAIFLIGVLNANTFKAIVEKYKKGEVRTHVAIGIARLVFIDIYTAAFAGVSLQHDRVALVALVVAVLSVIRRFAAMTR